MSSSTPLEKAETSVSVVVIALNEGDHLRTTVENLESTLPVDSEILVVDDGSEDGSTDFLSSAGPRVNLMQTPGLGVAKARNWGARRSSGDVIVFADAHIHLPDDWLSPLTAVLAHPGAGAAAPAIFDISATRKIGYGLALAGPDLDAKWLGRRGESAYPVPILPGCCLVMRRDVFLATGGFDDGLLSRGGVDNELGVRLWLLGYRLMVVPSVSVGHLFRRTSPYPVRWSTYLHNRIRLALLHLNAARIDKVLAALRTHLAFDAAMALAEQGDARRRRAELMATRAHDDDWFFHRFGLEW